jgi:hypothetical protein
VQTEGGHGHFSPTACPLISGYLSPKSSILIPQHEHGSVLHIDKTTSIASSTVSQILKQPPIQQSLQHLVNPLTGNNMQIETRRNSTRQIFIFFEVIFEISLIEIDVT